MLCCRLEAVCLIHIRVATNKKAGSEDLAILVFIGAGNGIRTH